MAALLFSGLFCGRTRTKEPLVDGYLFKEAFVGYPVAYDRWVEVWDNDGLPQIPTATYNGQQPEMISWNPNHTIYEDSFPFKDDTAYELVVEHYWGRAGVRINMPADFRIIRPDSSYRYDRDSTLTVTWHKSRGAIGYDVFVWVGYFYFDVSDTFRQNSLSYQVAYETTLADTSLTFASARFFPDFVGFLQYGEGQVVAQSYDGPLTEAGAVGNVEGHGYGIVGAANQPHEAYFLVQDAPVVALDRPDLAERARQQFVSRVRRGSGIPDTSSQPRLRRP
jgi:hypothetical protein